MNIDIKSLLIRVCGTISYLIVIFFFVTFILFLHNDIKDALKEAWSVSVSFMGVLATLGAAVIAANLFSDWKDERKYLNLKEQVDSSIKIIDEMQDDLDVFSKDYFNDINELKKLFYQLYVNIQNMGLDSKDIKNYKDLHLNVAGIFGEIWLNGNKNISTDNRFTIMRYRGEIWKMKTILIDNLNEKLNES